MATCRPRYIFEAKQRCLASQSGLPGQRRGCSPWKSFVLSTALGLNYDTLVTHCARSLCRKKVHSENWSRHRPCIDLFPMQPSCVSPPPYCHCTMTVGACGEVCVCVCLCTTQHPFKKRLTSAKERVINSQNVLLA